MATLAPLWAYTPDKYTCTIFSTVYSFMGTANM